MHRAAQKQPAAQKFHEPDPEPLIVHWSRALGPCPLVQGPGPLSTGPGPLSSGPGPEAPVHWSQGCAGLLTVYWSRALVAYPLVPCPWPLVHWYPRSHSRTIPIPKKPLLHHSNPQETTPEPFQSPRSHSRPIPIPPRGPKGHLKSQAQGCHLSSQLQQWWKLHLFLWLNVFFFSCQAANWEKKHVA